MRYVVTYRPDQYAGNPHAADAPGLATCATTTIGVGWRPRWAELTDESFDWARRRQY